jgi:multiple sugar transport system substrate-binding protein
MLTTFGSRISRRSALASAGGAGALALLAACGQSGAGQSGGQSSAGAPKGKVVFMSQSASPDDQQRYKPLVDQYNAKAGPVTIDWIPGDTGGGAVDAQGKVIAMTAAGTPPDVFWTHAYIVPNLVKLNLLADVSGYISKDKDFKLSNYFEAPMKDYQIGGKQYGITREATTTILIYNKELFQKNGVSFPTDSWTWDDYLKAAQQLTKGDGTQKTWGAAGWIGQGSAQYYTAIKAWQEGGDIVDSTRTKFTLNQSPAVDQVQWLADLVSKQHVHPLGDEFPGQNIQDSWGSGRIGMVTQICVFNSFNKAQFDWDIAPLPKGKTRVTRTASAGHSITSGSKNKDAAWEVLKYFGSKAAYEHWAGLGLTVPTYKEVAASPLVINPNQPPKSAKIAQDAFAYARPEPISGDWGNVGAELGKAYNDIYAGKVDAKTGLTAITPIIESLLAKTPSLAPATPAK